MKYSVSICFLAGVLLFFLPFVEIKCNATPLYEAKGIDLVTGFTVKDGKHNKEFDETSIDIKNERQQGNTFAIAAFALGILGLILSLLNFKSQPAVCMITGALAAFSLIGLLIDLKSDLKKWNGSSIKKPDNDFLAGLANIKVSVEFTAWFYISLISFLAAAYFAYQKGLPSSQRRSLG